MKNQNGRMLSQGGSETKTSSQSVLIVIALMLGVLLSTLDTTIVSSAMPNIVRDIHGLDKYSWAFTAYMLTSTVFLPVLGKMSDVYGRKKIYVAALMLFLAGSVISGAANSMAVLIAGRAVQGMGGAGFAPVAMAILGDLFAPDTRRKIQSAFAGVFAIGTISGSVLGGIITASLSWHWVFWVNIPVVLIDLFLILFAYKETSARNPARFDVAGTTLLMVSLTTLMLTLAMGGVEFRWTSPPILGLAICSLGSFGWLLYIEGQVSHPVIPLNLFRQRPISLSVILIFFMGAALFGIVSFLPLYIQGVMGVDPATAGTVMTPGMLSMAIASVAISWMLGKTGPRIVVVASNLILVGVFYALSHLTPVTPVWHIVMWSVVLGLAFGSLQAALFNTIQDHLTSELRGIGISLAEFSHIIGGTVGVTVMTTVMNVSLTNKFNTVTWSTALPTTARSVVHNPNLLLDAAWKGHLPLNAVHTLQEAFGVALNHAFGVSLVIVALAAVGGLWLVESRRSMADMEAATTEARKAHG